jgi:mRNA interferase RelE/StbE
VSAATQVYYTAFDHAFFRLSPQVQTRIQSKIDDMGSRLASFSHHRLTGSERFRLRVGDYRIIYAIDVAGNEVHLLSVGHRREIYRGNLT